MENWREELNTILEGIDEEETHNEKGWWETSLGAEFGREVKVLIIKLIDQELDKAREEGRLSVIQELLFEPEEPSHNIGTLEAAFKYEDIIKRYSGEWRNKTGLVSPKYIKSKLKDNK